LTATEVFAGAVGEYAPGPGDTTPFFKRGSLILLPKGWARGIKLEGLEHSKVRLL
jgi:hypothetical protein